MTILSNLITVGFRPLIESHYFYRIIVYCIVFVNTLSSTVRGRKLIGAVFFFRIRSTDVESLHYIQFNAMLLCKSSARVAREFSLSATVIIADNLADFEHEENLKKM